MSPPRPRLRGSVAMEARDVGAEELPLVAVGAVVGAARRRRRAPLQRHPLHPW